MMLAQIQLDYDLVASLKEMTQQQGENVEEVLTELVQQYLRQSRREKIRREMEWYEQAHATLKTSYLGEHVAIHEGRVVDHDKDVAVLAQRIRQRYGRLPILITQISNEPMPDFTIRRPQLVQTSSL